MGTLYSQKERDYRRVATSGLEAYLTTLKELAKKHGLSVSDVIAASTLLEQERANDLYANNGDAFDEQIAGIGQELQRIAIAVESLASRET